MSNNSSTEVRGKRLYEAGMCRLEETVAHVDDGGFVYHVNIEETGPVCLCDEFETWGTCPHAVAVLHALGDDEPDDDEWYAELEAGYRAGMRR